MTYWRRGPIQAKAGNAYEQWGDRRLTGDEVLFRPKRAMHRQQGDLLATRSYSDQSEQCIRTAGRLSGDEVLFRPKRAMHRQRGDLLATRSYSDQSGQCIRTAGRLTGDEVDGLVGGPAVQHGLLALAIRLQLTVHLAEQVHQLDARVRFA